MPTTTAENLEKIVILYNYPNYLDLIIREVDKIANRYKNLGALERRIMYKVAQSLERGFTSPSSVRSVIGKAIAAEHNRTNKALAQHNVVTFTALSTDNHTYDIADGVDIEATLLVKESVKKVVSLATNDEELLIINGLADGHSEKHIGELLAQLYPAKKADTHRKSVRKFKERCALSVVV